MSIVKGGNTGEGEFDLFNANILERLPISLNVDGLLIRPLRSTDYDKGFIQLLGQLTEVGSISKDQYLSQFQKMKKAGCYYIVVVEDLNNGRVIASATLVAEQKFIHNCAVKGRLEDVVVNNNYRGKQLGKLVVRVIVHLSRTLQCYKLSLDCRDHLIPFYESLGFKRELNNANSLNMRFNSGNGTEQSHL